MLKETIETGLRMKVITPAQIQHINVGTTVQTKAVRFPTDARLYNRARERLVKTARKLGLQIKQSHQRVGPRLLMQQVVTPMPGSSNAPPGAPANCGPPSAV
jgi:IS5 family transposase